MEVKIDGKFLVLRVPITEGLPASPTGKTLQVASSHGNLATAATLQGQPIVIGLNAYIRNPKYQKPTA
jgi:hypothetical protein